MRLWFHMSPGNKDENRYISPHDPFMESVITTLGSVSVS